MSENLKSKPLLCFWKQSKKLNAAVYGGTGYASALGQGIEDEGGGGRGWSRDLGLITVDRHAHRKLQAHDWRIKKHVLPFTWHTFAATRAEREFCPWLFSRPTPTNIHRAEKKQQLWNKQNDNNHLEKWFFGFWYFGLRISLKCQCKMYVSPVTAHTLPPAWAVHRCGPKLDVSSFLETCYRIKAETRI